MLFHQPADVTSADVTTGDVGSLPGRQRWNTHLINLKLDKTNGTSCSSEHEENQTLDNMFATKFLCCCVRASSLVALQLVLWQASHPSIRCTCQDSQLQY